MSLPVSVGPLPTRITGPTGHVVPWTWQAKNWRGGPRGWRLQARESETGDPAGTGSPSGVERRIVSVEMMRDLGTAVESLLTPRGGAPTPPLPLLLEEIRALPRVRAAGLPLLQRCLCGRGASEEPSSDAPALS